MNFLIPIGIAGISIVKKWGTGGFNVDYTVRLLPSLGDFKGQILDIFKTELGIFNPKEIEFLSEEVSKCQLIVALDSSNNVIGAVALKKDSLMPYGVNSESKFKNLSDNGWLKDNGLEIFAISVSPEYTGKGIGKRLFEESIKYGRDNEQRSIWLGTEKRLGKEAYWQKKMTKIKVDPYVAKFMHGEPIFFERGISE